MTEQFLPSAPDDYDVISARADARYDAWSQNSDAVTKLVECMGVEERKFIDELMRVTFRAAYVHGIVDERKRILQIAKDMRG